MVLPENFENDLIQQLQPIRYYALAATIYNFFESGVYDQLKITSNIDNVAETLNLNKEKLKGFLLYLKNENLVDIRDSGTFLTSKGKELEISRPWYTMLIGGYGNTFLEIGKKIFNGAGDAGRNAEKVGIGSCGISHFDALPLTKSLLSKLPVLPTHFLDLGCGNGYYLLELCKMFPGSKACGVEPDYKGYIAAQTLLKLQDSNIRNSINLYNSNAIDFLDSNIDYKPDVLILGFVLHEILGQSGKEELISFLRKIISKYPDIYIVVIEVEDKINGNIMNHELALAYYNPYYLLHYFTSQRLEDNAFWVKLFYEAGLKIIHQQTVDHNVDSTDLEVGYLLSRK